MLFSKQRCHIYINIYIYKLYEGEKMEKEWAIFYKNSPKKIKKNFDGPKIRYCRYFALEQII